MPARRPAAELERLIAMTAVTDLLAKPYELITLNESGLPPFVNDPRIACLGREHLFFADGVTASFGRARAMCGRCPFTGDCLAYSIPIRRLYGIWGGAGPQERTQIRKVWAARHKARSGVP